MKFCAYLKSVDEDAPAAFRGKFLNYKQLKKFLKYRARRIDLASKGVVVGTTLGELVRSSRQEVTELLQEQLRLVDRYRPWHRPPHGLLMHIFACC